MISIIVCQHGWSKCLNICYISEAWFFERQTVRMSANFVRDYEFLKTLVNSARLKKTYCWQKCVSSSLLWHMCIHVLPFYKLLIKPMNCLCIVVLAKTRYRHCYCKCPKILNTKMSDKITYVNSAAIDQSAPGGAVWSGSTFFAIPLSSLSKR